VSVPASHGRQAEVEIHYRRLPGRLQVFRQLVLEDAGDYVVTYLPAADLPKPVTAGGRIILEPGAPVVWITYRERWHDVGRFHLADGTFTGVYANVLTPVMMDGARWETTDLCLDVWLGADGEAMVLDEDELRAAEDARWIDAATAARAREEAQTLMDAARRGEWPPREGHEWTLERARETVSRPGAGHQPGLDQG
jgi:predicted RNA-binding protein associated with RNAse of E/G family